jgi:ketose-bisphosphate aldolase
MALVKMQDLLRHAVEGKYSVGYFESWNLESTYAVVRAAEAARSPVIIGCCGEYVENPERKWKEHLGVYAAMYRAVAEEASVPVATLLNEADDVATVWRGIRAGFSMVMFADDEMPVERLEPIQQRVVEFAHASGIAVEAEVGSLPMAHGEGGGLAHAGLKTDPEVAARFVERTHVDALAVSIGNVHLLESRKAPLDLELLKQLASRVKAPLVLHGGTGIDRAEFKEAARLGVAKVNVGAGLKRVVIEAERRYYAATDVGHLNPNDVLGTGGPSDVGVRGQEAVMEEVLSFMRAFGSENKAR